MIISNNTPDFYYLGRSSLALAAGATLNLSNDIYNNDDSVALRINELDYENKINVVSGPSDYPRIINDSEVEELATNLLPSRVSIELTQPWKGTVGFGEGENDAFWTNYRLQNTFTQGDWISWDILLRKGTWTMQMLGERNTGLGIGTIYYGGNIVGAIDQYGVFEANQRYTLPGIVVPSTKERELKIAVDTKNASSSNYGYYIMAISFLRTGD